MTGVQTCALPISDLYKVIININEVLANIDRVAEKDKEYDALMAHTLKGALVGMRAWTYLTLVRLYNQVVFIDDNLTSIPGNLTQNVLGREAILDTLINQLETYFKSEYTTTKYVEYRLEYYVNNKALLGELYLEVGRYAEAATYLKLACESYQNQAAMLKVDRTYQNAAWGAIFLNSESQYIENIMVIPYSRAENQFNPLASWLGYNAEYLVRPSTILVDSFMAQIPLAGDVPMDMYRGPITFGAMDIEWNADSTYKLVNTFIRKYAVDPIDPESSDIIIDRKSVV